jgi:hemolysin III
MIEKFREPASGLSHFIGTLLSILALGLLLHAAIVNESTVEIVAYSIFGASMIFLYSASTIYHLIKASEKVIIRLRKLDHAMIFVLIAGSYTPLCLIPLRGELGYLLLSTLWITAICGIIFKMLFINAPRWFYTMVYIVMGWAAVFVIFPLYKAVGLAAIIWLVVGGLFYTIGGVIYALKKPNFIPNWLGFHELFHILIILGTMSHFLMVYLYC